MVKTQAIGSRIIDNYNFLRKIAKCSSEEKRISILRNASSEELLSLVEIASNIISSNFCLSKKQREKILPHANYIRKLARVRSEVAARKVAQRGAGFILPSLIIPIVSEAARYLLSNSNKGIVEDN